MIYRTFSVKEDEIRGWWHYADVKGHGKWKITYVTLHGLETQDELK